MVSNDVIYGGNGNDIINGGSETNLLYGSDGNDTYKINTADSGTNTIIDSDGSGSVVLNGTTLSGGDYFDINQYSDGNKVTNIFPRKIHVKAA